MQQRGYAAAFPVSPSPGKTPTRFFLCLRGFPAAIPPAGQTVRYFPVPAGLPPFRCLIRPHPPPLAADAAMARARRRSRTPGGRTERRSRRGHRPAGTAGKVRADAQRHAADEVQPHKRDAFRVTAKGEYGGAGGVEGEHPPLTPCTAPGRRPAAHAGQQPLDKRFQKIKSPAPAGIPAPCLRTAAETYGGKKPPFANA